MKEGAGPRTEERHHLAKAEELHEGTNPLVCSRTLEGGATLGAFTCRTASSDG